MIKFIVYTASLIMCSVLMFNIGMYGMLDGYRAILCILLLETIYVFAAFVLESSTIIGGDNLSHYEKPGYKYQRLLSRIYYASRTNNITELELALGDLDTFVNGDNNGS